MAVAVPLDGLADVLEELARAGIVLRIEGSELRAKPRPVEELVQAIREHRDELYLWTLGRAVQAGTEPLGAFMAALVAYEAAR